MNNFKNKLDNWFTEKNSQFRNAKTKNLECILEYIKSINQYQQIIDKKLQNKYTIIL